MKKTLLLSICLIVFSATFAQETEEDIRIAGDYKQVVWPCEIVDWAGEDYDIMGNPRPVYAYRYRERYYVISGDYLNVYDANKELVMQFYDTFNNLYARHYYEIGEYSPYFFVPAKGSGPVFILLESTENGGSGFFRNGGNGTRVYVIDPENEISEAGHIHVSDNNPSEAAVYNLPDSYYQPVASLLEIRNIPEGQKITFSGVYKYTPRYNNGQILLLDPKDLYYIYSEGKLTELGKVTTLETYRKIKLMDNIREPYDASDKYQRQTDIPEIDGDGHKEYIYNGLSFHFNGFEIIAMDFTTRDTVALFNKLNEYGYVSGVIPSVAFFTPPADHFPAFLIISDAIEYEVYAIEKDNRISLSGRLHIGNYLTGNDIYDDLEIRVTDNEVCFSFNTTQVYYSFRYDKKNVQTTELISSEDIRYIYDNGRLREEGLITVYPYSAINRLIGNVTDNFSKKLWDYAVADLNGDGKEDITYTLRDDNHLYVGLCADDYQICKTMSVVTGSKEEPFYIESADSSEIKVTDYVGMSLRFKTEADKIIQIKN